MKRDGRTLDHGTLEEFRLLALRRVREGEKPSAVVKSLGMNRTSINDSAPQGVVDFAGRVNQLTGAHRHPRCPSHGRSPLQLELFVFGRVDSFAPASPSS